MKRQPTEREKIFANHVSGKGPVSIIINKVTTQQQKSKQFNNKKKSRHLRINRHQKKASSVKDVDQDKQTGKRIC